MVLCRQHLHRRHHGQRRPAAARHQRFARHDGRSRGQRRHLQPQRQDPDGGALSGTGGTIALGSGTLTAGDGSNTTVAVDHHRHRQRQSGQAGRRHDDAERHQHLWWRHDDQRRRARDLGRCQPGHGRRPRFANGAALQTTGSFTTVARHARSAPAAAPSTSFPAALTPRRRDRRRRRPDQDRRRHDDPDRHQQLRRRHDDLGRHAADRQQRHDRVDHGQRPQQRNAGLQPFRHACIGHLRRRDLRQRRGQAGRHRFPHPDRQQHLPGRHDDRHRHADGRQ